MAIFLAFSDGIKRFADLPLVPIRFFIIFAKLRGLVRSKTSCFFIKPHKMKKFSLPKDGGLIEAGLPNGVKHTYERIPAHIYEDEELACERLAEKIVDSINSNAGVFRLGLSTGSTPSVLFKELVKKYKAGDVSFKNVEIYSTDEYYPAPADSQSRNRRLYEDFIAHVDIRPENVFVPKITELHDSTYVTEFCAAYDAKASGLDLLVMGIGEKGQIGFNENGASEFSRTRTVLLPYGSLRDRQRISAASRPHLTLPSQWVSPQCSVQRRSTSSHGARTRLR